MGDNNTDNNSDPTDRQLVNDSQNGVRQNAGHLREAGRNIQRNAGAGLRREYQDDFIQLRINEQQRQYTFNIMRDFVFLGIFLYYFFFRDILGIRHFMFHLIYTGLTGKIYNETEIEEATKILFSTDVETIPVVVDLVDDIIAPVVENIVRPQPNCTRFDRLTDMVEEYVNKTSLDAFNRQQKDQRVNRSDMVLPIILFLMLASLGATIWELIQVRFMTASPGKDGVGTMRDKKNSLNRKCSLADLTVLRHDRKELRRKEGGHLSIAENCTAAGNTTKTCRPTFRDN